MVDRPWCTKLCSLQKNFSPPRGCGIVSGTMSFCHTVNSNPPVSTIQKKKLRKYDAIEYFYVRITISVLLRLLAYIQRFIGSCLSKSEGRVCNKFGVNNNIIAQNFIRIFIAQLCFLNHNVSVILLQRTRSHGSGLVMM